MEILLQKTRKFLKEKGFIFTFYKFIFFILRKVYKFFRETIPLGFIFLFSRRGVVKRTVQGNKMLLNLRDVGISRELALYGVHERNSTEEVKRIIKPGMRILEIGANIGYYALLEARLVGPSGRLYAVEPSPDNFDSLKNNIALNNLKNIYLHQAAFGEQRSKAIFYVYDRGNLSSFIKRDDLGMKAKEVEVEVLTLDNFLADKEVDFIRMDVEGYEREILRGAEKVFSEGKCPRYLFIEVHSDLLHKKGSSAREIIMWLRERGYGVRKSFWRGKKKKSVQSVEEMLAHPLLEIGYWETFFERK